MLLDGKYDGPLASEDEVPVTFRMDARAHRILKIHAIQKHTTIRALLLDAVESTYFHLFDELYPSSPDLED